MDDDAISVHVENDEFDEISERREKLEHDLHQTQAAAYSKGTLQNLVCQWKSFIRFCHRYGYLGWPTSVHVVCLYAQFLAYTFKSAKAIRSYLSGVKLLHLLSHVDPPDLKDIEVSLTMKGMTKKLARPVKRTQPITPDIMLDMLVYLNLKLANQSSLLGHIGDQFLWHAKKE